MVLLDYFFQTEMAEQFNHHGYDFYALDLRKYGRSNLRSSKISIMCVDLNEYDAEITQALEIIGKKAIHECYLQGTQQAA